MAKRLTAKERKNLQLLKAKARVTISLAEMILQKERFTEDDSSELQQLIEELLETAILIKVVKTGFSEDGLYDIAISSARLIAGNFKAKKILAEKEKVKDNKDEE